MQPKTNMCISRPARPPTEDFQEKAPVDLDFHGGLKLFPLRVPGEKQEHLAPLVVTLDPSMGGGLRQSKLTMELTSPYDILHDLPLLRPPVDDSSPVLQCSG